MNLIEGKKYNIECANGEKLTGKYFGPHPTNPTLHSFIVRGHGRTVHVDCIKGLSHQINEQKRLTDEA